MAVETVVIKITGDSKDLNKTIDQLEKLGKVDRQNSASFKKTSEQNQKSIKKTEGSLKGLEKQLLSMGGALIGAFAIQQVLKGAIDIIKEFEKELSTLQSITGSTAEEMRFFSEAAKDIGRATETSATEVVKAFTLIGSAQPELLKSQKALSEVTEQALILSQAAGIDTVAAAEALTGAMNQFGASAEDAAKFTDIFATSQQKGSSFIQATAEALKNTGAAASAAGLSFETTNAAIQALAKGSLLGSEAGTSLRGVLIKLSSQTDSTINPSLVGLGNTIDELASRNLSLADATKLVGQEGATGLLTLIKQNKTFKELDGNLNETGNALEQMRINTDNLDGALKRLDNALEDAALEGSSFGNVLKFVVDDVALGLSKLTGETAETKDQFSLFGTILKAIRINFLVILVPIREAFKLFLALGRNLKDTFSPAIESVGNFFEKTIIPVFTSFSKIITSTVKTLFAFGETILSKVGINIDLSAKSVALFNEIMGNTEEEVKDATKAAGALAVALSGTEGVSGAASKSVSAIDALNKRIGDLRKELINQALAGDISKDTINELNESIDELTTAQVDLLLATTTTLPFMEAQALALDDIGDSAQTAGQAIKDLEEIQRAEAQATAETRLTAIGIVSDAEQQAFAILTQLNTNKLIAIDNEETKALRALDAQSLGEEELAQRRKEIQEKSAEERAIILTKQAKEDKLAAIFEATINTAAAVTRALIVSPLFAALVGALGLAEIAVIAAQPIPTFHEGKKPELKEGEMYAKILKSESVIPPAQSKKYKGAVDAMIDQRFEKYVYDEYMLPMMKGMEKKDASPYNDIHIWNNQKKQIRLTSETNNLLRGMNRSLEPSNRRRSWN